MHTRTISLLAAVLGFVGMTWACGSSDSSADANQADECTPRGALYACQATPSCEPNYMPLSGISCGSHGGSCCIKGALPPADASSDSAADEKDECTPRGAAYACQANPSCEPNYMPLSGTSCGSRGGYCCIKGALPPTDASSDG
jgi:hypothetical protein